MVEEQIVKLVKDSVELWGKASKNYRDNQPKFGKKARAINPKHIEGGRFYNNRQIEHAVESAVKKITLHNRAVVFSTITDLNSGLIPGIGIPLQADMTPDMQSSWPGEEVLKRYGLTMVICPDGKTVMLYDDKVVKVLETDEHKQDLQRRVDAARAAGVSEEDIQKLSESDIDMNGMFGGGYIQIAGTDLASSIDTETAWKMAKNLTTARVACGHWAQLLETRDKDRKITPKAVRNGIPAIAWKKKKAEAMMVFSEEIARELDNGTSMMYSTDKEFNGVEATSVVGEVREKVKNGSNHVYMMVEPGKVSILSSGLGERVIYEDTTTPAASSGDPE